MTPMNARLRFAVALSTALTRLRLAPSPMTQADAPAERRQAIRVPAWMGRPGDRSLEVALERVDARGGPLRVRTYRKPGTPAGSPAILYLHGGGFVLGGLDACDFVVRSLCALTGFPVLSVEYRLAPECPFPGPLEDCCDVLQWLRDTCPHGIDPTRIAVAGDSAGANLAAALTLLSRADGRPPLRHQTLVYPFTDATLSSTDWDTRAMAGAGRSLGEQMLRWYAPGHPVEDPLLSVLHADHAGLPPALVITAEHDVLHADGTAYASKLAAAGVPVVLHDVPGVPHGFLGMPRLTPESGRCLALIATEITAAMTETRPGATRGATVPVQTP
jgi:acetyl esterase